MIVIDTADVSIDDSHKYSRGIDLMTHQYSRGIDLMNVMNTAEVST